MTFLSPERLWLLAAVVALAVVYLLLQRRRRTYALRFSSADLFDSVAPSRPGFRRHVPPVVFLAALVGLVVAVAQPARQVRVPRERATVIVAIDVSLSMQATDVEPDRLQAAQLAANRFIEELPATLNVGVVSFAGTASVLVTPTRDRLPAHTAIDNLKLAESTAIGEAIFTSLDALRNAPPDETGELPPARIVLLSDGETTVGRPDAAAVAAAREAEVPVSTIAFGTERGTIVYDDPRTAAVESEPIRVPVRGGQPAGPSPPRPTGRSSRPPRWRSSTRSTRTSARPVGFELVNREITDWFAGLGLALLALSSALSLLWFQRLP